MIVFQNAAEEAIVALQAGRRVRLQGRRLSGRSTLLASIVDSLNEISVPLVYLRGSDASREQAGYGVERICAELGLNLRSRDSLGAVEAISSKVDRDWVVAIDDPHLVDSFSLKVLSAVRQETALRAVTTEIVGHRQENNLPASWPERTVPVPELDMSAVSGFLHKLFKGPVDPFVSARLYGKSGGIVGVLIALAEGALDEGLLERIDGVWRAKSVSLWAPSVEPVLLEMIADFEPAQSELLQHLAQNGPTAAASLIAKFGRNSVQRCLELRFISTVGVDHSALLQVWPPALASMFEHSPQVSHFEDEGHYLHASPNATGQSAGDTTGNELALLARSFSAHDAAALARTFSEWTADPSPRNASEYLAYAQANRAERRNVLRVLSETNDRSKPASSSDVELLMWNVQRLIFSEKAPNEARELGAKFAAENPEWRPTVEAGLSVLLTMGGEPAPAEYPELTETPNPVIQVSRLFHALNAGDQATWERELDLAAGSPGLDWVRDYAIPEIPFFQGEVTESLELALQRRSLAKERVDRSAFVVLSYIAIIAAQHLGEKALIRELISEVTVIGRPRPALDGVYGAIFVLGAIDAHYSGRFQAREDMLLEASLVSPEVGPFVGMGVDFTNAILTSGSDSDRFDDSMALAVAARIERGYVIGAIQTALAALMLTWGNNTADQLAIASRDGVVPLFANAVELCALLRERNTKAITEWAKEVQVRDDAFVLRRILGTAARFFEAQGDGSHSSALWEVSSHYFDGSPHRGGLTMADSPIATNFVSKRERQVGMLAGRFTNFEIAEQLGLSSRTVENHIASARKKVNAATRHELAAILMSGLRP